MFFERINSLRHTLAFRLTVWYAAIFVFSASVTFTIFYFAIQSALRQRVDEDLRIQSNEFAATYALQGAEFLKRSAMLQAQAAGERKMFFRLFYPSGVVFSSSNMSYWKDIGIDRLAVEAVLRGARHVYATSDVKPNGPKARLIYTSLGRSIVLQLGYSLENETQTLQTFNRIFTVTMTAMLGLAVAVGWFMARRALSGVATLTRTAQQISESDLDLRVPVHREHDEIDNLAITFNQMLDRIQKLIMGIQQMNDNIAHDLRSPITRIRGLAEVTLTGAANLEDYAHMAANTVEECDRLLSMINTMLTISRTEAGMAREQFAQVNFSAVVGEAFELFQPLAEDKGISLSLEASGGIHLRGDQAMLQRLAANLIDNAVKYTPAGGRVDIALKAMDSKVRLTVSDTGIGISPDDQARIFDRFFRGDQSRSQGGAGLGLSLAQAIAHAHGGEIHLESVPGRGSIFSLHLPAGSSPSKGPIDDPS